MTEQEFKDLFVCNFISAWCGDNYVDYCMRGLQHELDNPPMEDAVYLANKAWEKYNEFK